MALSINIDGNSYELTGVDHPAEEETVRKLISTIEKYAKDDKDLKNKLLKEFKDQLDALNKTSEDILKKQTSTARAAPTTNNQPAQAAANTSRAFNSAANAAGASSKILGNLTTNAGFASNAIQSMNSGMQATSGVMSKLGAVGSVAGSVLGGLASAAGFAATSIISLATASMGAFMEAAASQGNMAKQGVVFTGSLQELNYAAARAGMTMEQLSEVMRTNSAAVTLLGRAGQSGASRFVSLITSARDSAQSLKGLGFTAQEEAQARADYIDILREQGSADQLRTMTDSQIIAQSTRMVKGFMGVAAVTGKTVDELMKKTKELAGSTDVRLTLDALNLSPAQRQRIAANFTVLESMGMGELKDVFLEMKTFGTSIGDLGIDLKTLGVGPQIENFLTNIERLDPADMQLAIINFSKTVNRQQVADLAARAQMLGSPAAKVLTAISTAASMSEADVKRAALQAAKDKESVRIAQEFNDALIQLKGAFTGVLLAIAESKGFQDALKKMIQFINANSETISRTLGNLGAALFNFLGMLMNPEGRQQIINDFRSMFTEILIGIKKQVLRPIGLYDETEEKRDRELAEAQNASAMAQTQALAANQTLAQYETKLTNQRLELLNTQSAIANRQAEFYATTDAKRRQELQAEIDSLRARREALSKSVDETKAAIATERETTLKESPAVREATQTLEEKTAEQDKNRAGMGTIALGVLGAGTLLMLGKHLLTAGLERLILGAPVRTGGIFGGGLPGMPGGGLPGAPGGGLPGAPGGGLPGAPTTAKGIGMGALSDVTKGLTGALTWAAKGAAIAGAMYLIGKALPTLADGVKSFGETDPDSLAKAGAALATVTGGLMIMSKVPLKGLGTGLLVFAGVAGAMYALGMGLNKLVEPLKAFADISWETLGKGGAVLGVITAAIFGLGAIISSGAGAVVFGAGILGFLGLAAAIGALGLAMQQLPMPVMELFAKVFTDVVSKVADVVKNIFATIPDIINAIGSSIATVVTSITDGIGKIIDKIAAYKTAGIEATTVQIERLSAIPSERIQSTATAVTALKEALDGFGGGYFENIGKSIASMFGADQASQLERTAAAMDRYKSSVSVLRELSNGEFVLKPVDVGLYEQLQETLDQTKVQINTTFSKKTYEETFRGTTKAIDGTYNHLTSKLSDTLTATKNAIRDTFKPPVEALKELSDTIVGYVKLATQNIGSPTGGGKIETQADWLAAVTNYFGGSNTEATGSAAELRQYVEKISPKEGGHNSINPETFAMGRIQLMPATLVGLARQRGDKRFSGRSVNTTAEKRQLAEDWKKLSDAEKDSYYQAYALDTFNQLKRKLGRNPTQREWYAAQFGVADVSSAILNPTSALSASQVRAVGANQRVFDEYTGGRTSTPTPSKPALPTDASIIANAGGTLRTGAGFKQLRLDEKGRIVDESGKESKSGTLTAVSNENDTEEKILNILEQTFNLHADRYQKERFRGFTAFTG